MSRAEIGTLVSDFAKAVKLAVAPCVDVVEIHAFHWYLLHQFFSPMINRRQDNYGGSFENRIRVVIEVIQAVLVAIPDTMPLFVRKALADAGKKLLIGTVGEITDAKQADDVVQEVPARPQADLISVGRAFLRDPSRVMKVAEELGVDAAWPTQIARPQIVRIIPKI
jgi:2,4-dienoyl-CoA reductase-like NADH-dependent reductase (Old Yellow Enzyme family)